MTSRVYGPANDALGFVDDLNGAIRENPVAAGLIGMGVLWMIFGNSKVSALGSRLPEAARAVGGAIGAAAASGGTVVGDAITGASSLMANASHKISDAVSSAAGSATSAVQESISGGGDKVAGLGEATYETLGRGAKTAVQAVESFRTPLQQNLNRALEKQPLLLGAIGLIIGAGIASAFPTTKVEQDVMGEAGTAVKDKIQEATEFATERAKQVFDDVKNEAEAQGLTAAGATEALKGVAGKVKSAATSSGNSVKQRLG
jgi:hypothetical protein